MKAAAVTVAVVDSGIDASVPGLEECVTHAWKGEFHDYVDRHGHGTTCAWLIHESAPSAAILDLKVFDQKLVTTPRILLAALDWSVDQGVDVVSISIAIPHLGSYREVVAACERARAKGMLVVAAADNFGRACLPAYVDSVIGVGACLGEDDNAFYYLDGHPIGFYAKGDAPALAAISRGRGKAPCASFATARMAGHIAALLARGVTSGRDSALQYLREVARPLASAASVRRVTDYQFFDLRANTRPLSFRNRRAETMERVGRAALVPLTEETLLFREFADLVPFGVEAVVDLNTGRSAATVPADLAELADVLRRALANADTLILVRQPGMDERLVKMASEVCAAAAKGVLQTRGIATRRPAGDDHPPSGVFFDNRDDEIQEVLADVPLSRVYLRDAPVLAVVPVGLGRLGAWRSELLLRRLFLANGLKLGQIGSGEYAEMFGFDHSFSPDMVTGNLPAQLLLRYGRALVESVDAASNESRDLVVVAAPFSADAAPFERASPLESDMRALSRLAFLQGVNPDGILLVVNELAPDAMIDRCGRRLASLVDTAVLGVVTVKPRADPRDWLPLIEAQDVSQPPPPAARRQSSAGSEIPWFELDALNDQPRLAERVREYLGLDPDRGARANRKRP